MLSLKVYNHQKQTARVVFGPDLVCILNPFEIFVDGKSVIIGTISESHLIVSFFFSRTLFAMPLLLLCDFFDTLSRYIFSIPVYTRKYQAECDPRPPYIPRATSGPLDFLSGPRECAVN